MVLQEVYMQDGGLGDFNKVFQHSRYFMHPIRLDWWLFNILAVKSCLKIFASTQFHYPYSLSHLKNDCDVTEHAERVNSIPGSFLNVRKHTSCAGDNKRLPSEYNYALTSRLFSRWEKVYNMQGYRAYFATLPFWIFKMVILNMRWPSNFVILFILEIRRPWC